MKEVIPKEIENRFLFACAMLTGVVIVLCVVAWLL